MTDTEQRADTVFPAVVNSHPIVIGRRRPTGLEIKEGAIAAGVQIDLSFQLSVRRGPRHTEVIGDDERITLSNKLSFTAVAGDDNS